MKFLDALINMAMPLMTLISVTIAINEFSEEHHIEGFTASAFAGIFGTSTAIMAYDACLNSTALEEQPLARAESNFAASTLFHLESYVVEIGNNLSVAAPSVTPTM